ELEFTWRNLLGLYPREFHRGVLCRLDRQSGPQTDRAQLSRIWDRDLHPQERSLASGLEGDTSDSLRRHGAREANQTDEVRPMDPRIPSQWQSPDRSILTLSLHVALPISELEFTWRNLLGLYPR